MGKIEQIRQILKPYQRGAERFVFPLVLAACTFIGVFHGLDVTDTTYSPGNAQYMEAIDPMWVIATYVPHIVGRFLMRLPFGNTFAGLNLYCTLFPMAAALSAYYLLQRFMPAWMVFAGEWIAISLCFCPRAILYNYLTYLFFTLGTLLLLHALSAETQRKRMFLLAGACFGLNVTVRLPNITHVVMIVCVLFYGRITGERAGRVFKQVLLCVCGFFAGFLVPFTAICLQFGSYAFAEMVADLFSMSRTAEGYGALDMIVTTLRAYGRTLSHLAILLPCMAAGLAMFLLWREKYVRVKKVLYVAGLCILARYYLGRGVFTLNYWYYDSMFQAAMMFLIVTIALCITDTAGFLNGSAYERALSLAALVAIGVLPLGTNNYTYPILDCLFIIAPASFSVIRRALRAAQRSAHAVPHFVWTSAVCGIVLVLLVQGTLFRLRFSFRDGMDGTPRDTVITEIPKLNRMVTTADNAQRLTALYAFLEAEGLRGRETLLFGDIPGLAYMMDLPPAIFSIWPDLESNVTERFDEALSGLSSYPVVVTSPGGTTRYAHSERKYTLLLMYMDRAGYETVYDDGVYRVSVPADTENGK